MRRPGPLVPGTIPVVSKGQSVRPFGGGPSGGVRTRGREAGVREAVEVDGAAGEDGRDGLSAGARETGRGGAGAGLGADARGAFPQGRMNPERREAAMRVISWGR